MLNSETISAIESLIENFGFPIFVALCALVFFWQMFVYMRAAMVKKDTDFLAYIQSANQQFADCIAKRDEQIDFIIKNQNRALRKNPQKLSRLPEPVRRRRDSRRGRKETKTTGKTAF